ncbi:hypothetical protein OE88DRAFT_909107 [Heliocybe sulcata]|uniref:Uncharacterized protein n=1 Tax=Heliocybe sulcata TaxID=5364 RepID=A0A5C3MP95_9AGAM|nr:hypothetical protein OE88DRAFT_909107 [Heliocybe sulcata]
MHVPLLHISECRAVHGNFYFSRTSAGVLRKALRAATPKLPALSSRSGAYGEYASHTSCSTIRLFQDVRYVPASARISTAQLCFSSYLIGSRCLRSIETVWYMALPYPLRRMSQSSQNPRTELQDTDRILVPLSYREISYCLSSLLLGSAGCTRQHVPRHTVAQ